MDAVLSFLTSLSLWGSIVNCIAVLVGSTVGLLLRRFMKSGVEGGLLSRISDALMKGIALCTVLIGISGAVGTQNIMIVILSMVLGAIIGTLIDLDRRVESLGARLEKKTGGRFGNITHGFVSACLLFCVGSMTIMGALNSGLYYDHTLLYSKSLLDLISSMVFASTLGFGVLFSTVFVLVFQGSITLLAGLLAPYLSAAVICEMTAVGSLLIIGLGLNLLGVTKLKIMNYLPAIFLPILLCLFM